MRVKEPKVASKLAAFIEESKHSGLVGRLRLNSHRVTAVSRLAVPRGRTRIIDLFDALMRGEIDDVSDDPQ